MKAVGLWSGNAVKAPASPEPQGSSGLTKKGERLSKFSCTVKSVCCDSVPTRTALTLMPKLLRH